MNIWYLTLNIRTIMFKHKFQGELIVILIDKVSLLSKQIHTYNLWNFLNLYTWTLTYLCPLYNISGPFYCFFQGQLLLLDFRSISRVLSLLCLRELFTLRGQGIESQSTNPYSSRCKQFKMDIRSTSLYQHDRYSWGTLGTVRLVQSSGPDIW